MTGAGQRCRIVVAWWARSCARPAGLVSAVALAVACVLALTPGAARADSATFAPEADSYVSALTPDDNYGGASVLQMGASPLTRGYLRFDVQLPAGATVTGASLELYTTTIAPSAGFWAYAVEDTSWGEDSIDDSNAPDFGAKLAWSGGYATTGYKSVALPASYVSDGLV